MGLLHAAQLPFRDYLVCVAVDVGYCAFENGTLAAVGVYHALFVGDLPVIVGRAVALADDAREVATLTGVELPVGFAGDTVSTVGDAHRTVVVHSREHRA